MKNLLESTKNQYEYVLVDSAPMVLTADAEELVNLCDTALLVVRQDYAFVRVVNDTIDKLSENKNLLGIVFNASRTINFSGAFSERQYSRYYHKP